MFNLIISIIAIALVVVLAGASLYYGGDAFNRGSSDAKASTLINQAQQIQAAATLFKATEGGAPNVVTDLVSEYMTSIPKIPVGDQTGDAADAWELDKLGTNNVKQVVFVDLAIAAKTEAGITGEICKTINQDGAGVVFCSVSADGQFADFEPTEGSAEADVDAAVAADGSVARVYMAL